MNIEALKKVIKEGTEQQLNDTISKGALQMDGNEVATVSFIFWLVYMAETDLNSVIQNAWERSGRLFSPEVRMEAWRMLQEMIPGNKELDPNNLEYFSDKIKVLEGLFEESERTKLLWKLNDIRNDLSHNRIRELQYEDKSLYDRSTKEKVLIDYFKTSGPLDFEDTEFWKSLSEKERKTIERMFNELQGEKNQ